MISHADIVGALGVEALAAATGRKPIAVTRWYQRNQIPPAYWMTTVDLAKKNGLKSYNLEALAKWAAQ